MAGSRASTVSLERCRGREGRRTYSRKSEEFIADFCLVSRRVLDDADFALFHLHLVMGTDYRLCCQQLGIDRGTFFHRLYRLEQRLGRAFAELQPYPLYPPSDYFGSVERGTCGDAAEGLNPDVDVMVSRMGHVPWLGSRQGIARGRSAKAAA